MGGLKTEYTDIKDNKHKVQHLIASNKDNIDREQMVEELFRILTKPGKRITA